MPKYRLTYTRTLTLEKIIEAESFEAADKLGKEIEEELEDKAFAESHDEFEIDELKLERGAWVKVIAEGRHKGNRGKVYSMMPYSVDFLTTDEEKQSGVRWKVEVSIFGKGFYFWEDELELV